MDIVIKRNPVEILAYTGKKEYDRLNQKYEFVCKFPFAKISDNIINYSNTENIFSSERDLLEKVFNLDKRQYLNLKENYYKEYIKGKLKTTILKNNLIDQYAIINNIEFKIFVVRYHPISVRFALIYFFEGKPINLTVDTFKELQAKLFNKFGYELKQSQIDKIDAFIMSQKFINKDVI